MRGSLIFISLLVLWQAFVVFSQIPNYILPSPLLIIQTIVNPDYRQLLLSETIPTVIETLVGLFGGIIIGCCIALTMMYIRSLKHWLKPLLVISQALPTFAIAPLFVIWLGYGMSAKIAITVLMVFFPIANNFFDGLSKTDRNLLDLAHIMGASRLSALFHIRLPASLPHLFSGLRIATAMAPMGAVIGEWVGSSQGLGFLMLNANARMETNLMFAALFILVSFSLVLYFTIGAMLDFYAKITYYNPCFYVKNA